MSPLSRVSKRITGDDPDVVEVTVEVTVAGVPGATTDAEAVVRRV
jgi:hypothetical protein